jgi:hypothetical protein
MNMTLFIGLPCILLVLTPHLRSGVFVLVGVSFQTESYTEPGKNAKQGVTAEMIQLDPRGKTLEILFRGPR